MVSNRKKVIVIGSGFSGLSTAAFLAKSGRYDVTVVEKNDTLGGRARQFKADGYTFDMGPSWYWMPDVFDRFFAMFDKKVADYYELVRLDPSYTVCFGKDHFVNLPASLSELYALFEKHEPGSSTKLQQFLKEAKYKYEVGMNEFVHKPSHSIFEFADFRILQSLFKLQMFVSMESYLKRLFKNDYLLQILKFPVLFLGATPAKTPALYSLMNYADLELGTWYPKGGMVKIVEGMVSLAKELGVQFVTNAEVNQIEAHHGKVSAVHTTEASYPADVVVSGADYQHTEQKLLKKEWRYYSEKYWDSRVMAPSSLLFYLGINKRIEGLQHHNLFFDEDFGLHAHEIYESPKWPTKPLFYVCAPSKTDNEVAPPGHENLFLLMPVAPNLADGEAVRAQYFNVMMDRLEHLTNQSIKPYITYKKSFAHSDFKQAYHSFKGNAYGLANTLFQTAFLKPKMRSKKLENLFYTGQLTTPGPGVPPSIISGEVVAKEVIRYLEKT